MADEDVPRGRRAAAPGVAVAADRSEREERYEQRWQHKPDGSGA